MIRQEIISDASFSQLGYYWKPLSELYDTTDLDAAAPYLQLPAVAGREQLVLVEPLQQLLAVLQHTVLLQRLRHPVVGKHRQTFNSRQAAPTSALLPVVSTATRLVHLNHRKMKRYFL